MFGWVILSRRRTSELKITRGRRFLCGRRAGGSCLDWSLTSDHALLSGLDRRPNLASTNRPRCPTVVRGDRDDLARTDRKEGLPGHNIVELPKLSVREMVLQERPHAVRHRHHANLGLTAVRTALALDPELALLPEDVL